MKPENIFYTKFFSFVSNIILLILIALDINNKLDSDNFDHKLMLSTIIIIYIYEFLLNLIILVRVDLDTEKLKFGNLKIKIISGYCLLFICLNFIGYMIKDNWPYDLIILSIFIIVLQITIMVLKLLCITHLITINDLKENQIPINDILYVA